MKKLIIMALLLASTPAFAWVSADQVTVKSLIVWENAETSSELSFQLSNGTWCWIAPGQKILQSIVLALYTSGKPAEVHCYDAEDKIAGGSVPASHKLHRIIAK